MIAKYYIFSSVFVIDILSTFPLDSWFKSANEGFNMFLKLLGILKIQRLRRISKLIANLSCSHETKAMLKVIQMIFFLGLVLHLIACIFRYFIFQRENPQWVPPVDFVWAETKIYNEDML
jgi:hypothetical protein